MPSVRVKGSAVPVPALEVETAPATGRIQSSLAQTHCTSGRLSHSHGLSVHSGEAPANEISTVSRTRVDSIREETPINLSYGVQGTDSSDHGSDHDYHHDDIVEHLDVIGKEIHFWR